MKIILPEKIIKQISDAVIKNYPNETKGALFAKRISDELYEIEETYVEPKRGKRFFVKLFANYQYKKFQDDYHKKYKNDYLNHNYIGDWHSHPKLECKPSSYDISEGFDDLNKSNANFLIQLIVDVVSEKLIGNCFIYLKDGTMREIELGFTQLVY